MERPSGSAVPWLGLACASVLLAAPALSPGSIARRLDAQAHAATPSTLSEPRIIGEDEVAFGTFSLKLAGASSADDLWRRWRDLKQRQLGLFDDVAASVKPAGPHGAGFVLLVGEFRNAASAADACGALRAHVLPCEVVRRNGAAL
jgi:hypothetical protein